MKQVLASEGQMGTLEGALGSCDLLKPSCWDNGCGFPSLADADSCLPSVLDVGRLHGLQVCCCQQELLGLEVAPQAMVPDSSELRRGGLCSPLLWMLGRRVLCVLWCRMAPLREVAQSLHRCLQAFCLGRGMLNLVGRAVLQLGCFLMLHKIY